VAPSFGEVDFDVVAREAGFVQQVDLDGKVTAPIRLRVSSSRMPIRRSLRTCVRVACCSAVRLFAHVSVLLALLHAAAVLRQEVMVHQDDAKKDRLSRQFEITCSPSTSSTVASETGGEQRRLAVSRERYWGTPLPEWESLIVATPSVSQQSRACRETDVSGYHMALNCTGLML
jgi:isoleucyl-tRNA synthetase